MDGEVFYECYESRRERCAEPKTTVAFPFAVRAQRVVRSYYLLMYRAISASRRSACRLRATTVSLTFHNTTSRRDSA